MLAMTRSNIFRKFVRQAFPKCSGLFSTKTRRGIGEQQVQLIEIQRRFESHPGTDGSGWLYGPSQLSHGYSWGPSLDTPRYRLS